MGVAAVAVAVAAVAAVARGATVTETYTALQTIGPGLSVDLGAGDVFSLEGVSHGTVLPGGGVVLLSTSASEMIIVDSDFTSATSFDHLATFSTANLQMISPVAAAVHPDGSLIVTAQTSTPNGAINKITMDGLTPLDNTARGGSFLDGVSAIAIEQTGDQRMFFVVTDVQEICRYNAALDAGSRTCTSALGPNMHALAIAPDDSFLISLSSDGFLRRLTPDMAVLSTNTAAVITGGFFTAFDIAFASDSGSFFVPDASNNRVLKVDIDLTSPTLLGNYDLSGTVYGSTTSACISPEAVTMLGNGDLAVICDANDKVHVLDEAFTSLYILDSSTVFDDSDTMSDGFLLNLDTGIGSQIFSSASSVFITPTVSNVVYALQEPVAAVGDPILVDVHGHRFVAGHQPDTWYVLYANGDTRIEMRTSDVFGADTGYFVSHLALRQACGSLELSPAEGMMETTTVALGCFADANMYAAGDNGLVVVPVRNALVLVRPMMSIGFQFLNLKIYGAQQPAFVRGCRGMLCDEKHADVFAADFH